MGYTGYHTRNPNRYVLKITYENGKYREKTFSTYRAMMRFLENMKEVHIKAKVEAYKYLEEVIYDER